MRSDYFIEFVYYEPALKQEEQFKFLTQKYKENLDSLKEIKVQKIKGLDKFLLLVDAFENEVKELKKSFPAEPLDEETQEEKPSIKPGKKIVKKTVKNKATIRKSGKELSDLRLGLEKIKDELSRM